MSQYIVIDHVEKRSENKRDYSLITVRELEILLSIYNDGKRRLEEFLSQTEENEMEIYTFGVLSFTVCRLSEY
jgi:hypothetical protein